MSAAEGDGAGDRAAGSRGGERAIARAAVCGGVATFGGLCSMAATLGLFGFAVANQSLLANLAVHAAALAGISAALLAVLGWRILGALGLTLALAVGFLHVERVRWTAVRPEPGATARLEVLHVNVMHQNPRAAEMARAIATSGADVVVVLEADGVEAHLGVLDAAYPYRFGCEGRRCETMILSRTPLEDARWNPLPFAEQRLASAVVRVGERPVRLVAAHFVKDFFAGLRSSQAFAVRRAVGGRAAVGAMPILMTGDFNATPWDPIVRWFTRSLRARHPAVWRPTWPVPLGPFGFPIDHIVVSDELRVERIERPPSHGSNHFGLRATIALKP